MRVRSSGSPGPAPTSETRPAGRGIARVFGRGSAGGREAPHGLLAVAVASSCRRASAASSASRRDAIGSCSRRQSVRSSRANAVQCSTSAPTSRVNASRSTRARAGASPPVDKATVTGPRRNPLPANAVACAGSSTAFTKMPRRAPSLATCALTSGGAALTTYQQPARSAGTNGRRCTSTGRASMAGNTCGATTTTWAPASSSRGIFSAATAPAPTISTRRPTRSRKAGKSRRATVRLLRRARRRHER